MQIPGSTQQPKENTNNERKPAANKTTCNTTKQRKETRNEVKRKRWHTEKNPARGIVYQVQSKTLTANQKKRKEKIKKKQKRQRQKKFRKQQQTEAKRHKREKNFGKRQAAVNTSTRREI